MVTSDKHALQDRNQKIFVSDLQQKRIEPANSVEHDLAQQNCDSTLLSSGRRHDYKKIVSIAG